MARGVRRAGARPVRDDGDARRAAPRRGPDRRARAVDHRWRRTIRAVGTEEQKQTFLPPVLAGEIIFALGYTEPDSGSDVAAAKTRAVRDGDDWVIDGQKMFTTLAHEAAYVFLLTRTNPDVPKHQGLTMFLVPLDAPGVEIHPVHTHGRRAHQRHLLHRRAGARRVPRRRGRRRLGRDDRRAHVRAWGLRARARPTGSGSRPSTGRAPPGAPTARGDRRSARAGAAGEHAHRQRGGAAARAALLLRRRVRWSAGSRGLDAQAACTPRP